LLRPQFAAPKDLGAEVDSKRTWETIRKNICQMGPKLLWIEEA
jgi:hypothetical protein